MKISSVVIAGRPGFEVVLGDTAIGFVPEAGGRVLSLKFRGEELLYAASGEESPYGVGGDKTWVAPEREWPDKFPFPDLNAGAYTFEQQGNACVMTSPVCRQTGLQVIRRFLLAQDGDIVLTETLRNTSLCPVTKGVWNVTQLRKPFDVFLPASEGAIRSYYHEDPTLPDPGFVPLHKDGWTVIPCRGDICYKFGGMIREGRAAVMMPTAQGTVVFLRVFDVAPQQPYAHGSMVEVFNAPLHPYGEFEVHSPLSVILPGEALSLTQLWRVYLSGSE